MMQDCMMTGGYEKLKVETQHTCVDFSKILGGQTKLLGGQKVVKSDKCKGVSQLLGGTFPGCPLSLCPNRERSGHVACRLL